MLATPDDVKDRLRRDLTETEREWAAPLLEEASVLVAGFLRRRGLTIDDDYPPSEVVIVVSRMVARALTTPETPNMPEGATSVNVGPFGARFGDPYTSSVFISTGDEKWLKNLLPSVVSLPLLSERGGFTDTCDD